MSHQQHSTEPIRVLVAGDDPGDVRLIEEAFGSTEFETVLHTVTDGYEAVHRLRRQGAIHSPSPPDLVLLDLDLPGKDGCEVLEAIRDEPHLRRLPVLMLAGSDDERDVARCYDAHANAYITKPADPEQFVAVIEGIGRFWFERVQLPPIPQ